MRRTLPAAHAVAGAPHGVVSGVSPSAILTLQRSAGNGAVGRWLSPSRRAAVMRTVIDTPTDYKDWSAIEAMSLLDLDTYAKSQADWHANPALAGPEVDDTRSILSFIREPGVLDACYSVNVGDYQRYLAGGDADTIRKNIRAFSLAVANQDPIDMQAAHNPNQANAFGANLAKLQAGGIPDSVLRSAMPMTAFRDLVIDDRTDDLITYYTTVKPTPILQAANGMDIVSFLLMHMTDAKDPVTYAGAPLTGKVRNYHRFEADALEQLRANYGNTTKTKPLTLILHSALDHNGAFHRDPELTAVIKNPDILALMIEGKETLDQVEGEIPGLATTYGMNNKLDQVMVAGHGESQAVELAGMVTEATETDQKARHHGRRVVKQVDNSINLVGAANQARAAQLLNKVLEHMDRKDTNLAALGRLVTWSAAPKLQPHRRILMNACLANTTSVPLQELAGKQLDAAAAAVRSYLKQNPSLAGYVRELAKAHDVTALGANASVISPGVGADERAHLVDAQGALGLYDKRDPQLVSPSKLAYVREGTEPVGVMRALLQSIATEGSDQTIDVMAKRITALTGKTAWSEVIIRVLFEIIRDNFTKNLARIAAFGIIAGRVKSLKSSAATVALLADMDGATYAAHTDRIMTALTTTDEWATSAHTRLVSYQVWQRIDKAKQSQLLATLASFTCQATRPFVDIAYLQPDLVELLPAPVATPPEPGRLRLALLGAMSEDAAARRTSLDYLSPLVPVDSTPRSFDTHAGAVREALGGIGGGEGGIAAKARPAPVGDAPPPSTDVAANLTAEGDDKNRLYVRSLTKKGKISVDDAGLRPRPDAAAASTPAAKDTEVFILGETTDGWYAVEYTAPKGGARGTRFVAKDKVAVV